MKNPNTSPPHLPSSLEDDKEDKNEEFMGNAGEEEDVESSSESESVFREEVDATPINRQDLPLYLTPAPGPTIIWWGHSSMQNTYNDGLSRLQNRRIKRILYLERRLTTIGITELP